MFGDEKLIQTILKQCEDEDGFISQLHVANHFDDDQWHIFTDVLERYVIDTEADSLVDKRVAGSVFFAYQIIGNALAHHQQVDSTIYKKLADAHHQIWELGERLFNSH